MTGWPLRAEPILESLRCHTSNRSSCTVYYPLSLGFRTLSFRIGMGESVGEGSSGTEGPPDGPSLSQSHSRGKSSYFQDTSFWCSVGGGTKSGTSSLLAQRLSAIHSPGSIEKNAPKYRLT